MGADAEKWRIIQGEGRSTGKMCGGGKDTGIDRSRVWRSRRRACACNARMGAHRLDVALKTLVGRSRILAAVEGERVGGGVRRLLRTRRTKRRELGCGVMVGYRLVGGRVKQA